MFFQKRISLVLLVLWSMGGCSQDSEDSSFVVKNEKEHSSSQAQNSSQEEGRCEGIPWGCSHSIYSCTSQRGCYVSSTLFANEKRCSGTPTPCSLVGMVGCSMQKGCQVVKVPQQ